MILYWKKWTVLQGVYGKLDICLKNKIRRGIFLILSNFEVDLGQDTLYSCKEVLIHEYMKNLGYKTDLELVDILNLSVLPIIQIEKTEITINDSDSIETDDGRNFYEQYGIETSIKLFSDFAEGWSYIKEQIAIGRPVIVSGTKYFLPYTKEYKSEKYFSNYGNGVYGVCNHWIMVMGYSEDKVYVRDPSFQFLGYIDRDDFEGFWEGDKQFERLNVNLSVLHCFGQLCVKVDEGINSQVTLDIAYSAVYQYLSLFLRNQYSEKKYAGIHAYDKLIELLESNEQICCDPQRIYNFFHMQKFNLMMVNQVIKKLSEEGSIPKECDKELETCVELLEEMCMKMYMCMLRKKQFQEYKDTIIPYLKKVRDKLYVYYQRVLERGNVHE